MVLRKLGSGALALAGFTHIEPYNSPLAVSEKAIGETPILGFFDRGGIKSSLPRPQDALGF